MKKINNDINPEEIEEGIKNNPRMMAFLAQYNAYDSSSFIRHYVNNKVYWHSSGERNVELSLKEEIRWIDKAQEHLEVILQKKLLDAQCLWRAEKVKYEEVQTCFDFQFWGERVLNCPFVDIEPADITMYCDYLLNDSDADVELQYCGWQYYELFKPLLSGEEDDEGGEEEDTRKVHPWYQYHNRITGLDLINLPDIRKEKEWSYARLAVDKRHAEDVKQGISQYNFVNDIRPLICYWSEEFILPFIAEFDDATTMKYYKAYLATRTLRVEEDMRYCIQFLSSLGEGIPMEDCDDWKDGVRKAIAKYKKQMMIKHLPEAYSRFRTFRDLNIDIDYDDRLHMEKRRVEEAKEILDGRELAGEPRDFNF